jgi:RimJ/RimL family protein N-acetyltransferase
VTKSVVALAAAGFGAFGLRRIEIYADVENVRSRRVAERAGFRLERTRPRRLADGRRTEEAVYVRLAPERPAG